MQPWIFLINTFEVNTRGSNRKMLTLVTDTHAKLNNEVSDPDILIIFDRLDPAYNAYRQICINYDLVEGNYAGETEAFENLMDTLPFEIRKWESKVRAVYVEDTPKERAIFPHKRNPYLSGNYEERLSAIGTLAEKLELDSTLSAAHIMVGSFYNLALSTRLTQQQEEGALGQLSDLRENQRVLVAEELYGALGVLMYIYRSDRAQIERFFDLTMLRTRAKGQTTQAIAMDGLVNNALGNPLKDVTVGIRLASEVLNSDGTGASGRLSQLKYVTTTELDGIFALNIDDLEEEEEATIVFSVIGHDTYEQTIMLIPGEDLTINATLQPLLQ